MRAVVTVTSKTIEFPHDNAIECMLVTILNHALKFRAVVGFRRHGAVDIIIYNLNIVICGELHTFAKLPFDRGFALIIRTISRINYCSHYQFSFMLCIKFI